MRERYIKINLYIRAPLPINHIVSWTTSSSLRTFNGCVVFWYYFSLRDRSDANCYYQLRSLFLFLLRVLFSSKYVGYAIIKKKLQSFLYCVCLKTVVTVRRYLNIGREIICRCRHSCCYHLINASR